jgi:signal transduction histidine kinase/ActR/RegA family two-component response regulator
MFGHQRQGYAEFLVTRIANSLGFVRVSRVPAWVLRAARNLHLRTKLLVSFLFLTAGLTSVILLVVRRNAEGQVQHQIEQDVQNADQIFQLIQRQLQTTLSHKADLLAFLAVMRDGDGTAVNDAGEDPWKSDECNLFIQVDGGGGITALHAISPSFPASAAQSLVTRSIRRGDTASWWFTERGLYQVVLRPYYDGLAEQKKILGTVIVGHLIDWKTAADLGKLTSTELVFRHGAEVAASSLDPLREMQLVRELSRNSAASQVNLGDERYYVRVFELAPIQQPAAELIVLKSFREGDAFLRRLNRLLLGVGLVAILAGSALIYLIADAFTRPLASLVAGVQALGRGNFTYPLRPSGRDELSELTRTFVGMRSTLQKNQEQREQLENQLRQAQKMEALGRLAGGVAHDFNNLLTVIRGHSELIQDRLKPEDALYRNSDQIRKTADRAAALTRQMLAFSRRQVLQPKVVDMNELITEMAKLLRRLVREDIEFNLRLSDSKATVKADPGQLEQVLLNLTVNASDAMPTGGNLTIETSNLLVDFLHAKSRPALEPGCYVVVSVSDTGHGMDEATQARIFEPFFTTKETGKGTGLGLATVYGVVKQSGGFIYVVSSQGNGSRFDIYLPQTAEPVEPPQVVANTKEVVANRKTVLVVEDQEEVREIVCQFLNSAGYRVLSTKDGKEALELAERGERQIHLVLTDIVMPRMRGPELARKLRALIPGVKLVFMTGYLDKSGVQDSVCQEAYFLQKPFSRESVIRQVAEALSSEKPVSQLNPAVPV